MVVNWTEGLLRAALCATAGDTVDSTEDPESCDAANRMRRSSTTTLTIVAA